MAMTAGLGADVVEVPGVTGGDFAAMSGALLRVMEQYGSFVPDPRPAEVIGETAVLCGPLRIATHARTDYPKCQKTGAHWAVDSRRAGS